jgi:hypothetical protein
MWDGMVIVISSFYNLWHINLSGYFSFLVCMCERFFGCGLEDASHEANNI